MPGFVGKIAERSCARRLDTNRREGIALPQAPKNPIKQVKYGWLKLEATFAHIQRCFWNG